MFMAIDKMPTFFVWLPGAGGAAERDHEIVDRFRTLGPAMVVDFPYWPWHAEHAGFDALAGEVARHIVEAVPAGARIALAGVSLGGPLAVLVARELGRHDHIVAWLAAIDPVLPNTSRLERGWWGRMRRRGQVARSSRFGLPSFLWMLAFRGLARLLAPRLAGWNGRARELLGVLAPPGSLFAKQLRMRLMIGGAAHWRDEPPETLSATPCRLFYAEDTPRDDDFWRSRFADVDIVAIDGDHDSLLDQEGPDRLFECYSQARQPN